MFEMLSDRILHSLKTHPQPHPTIDILTRTKQTAQSEIDVIGFLPIRQLAKCSGITIQETNAKDFERNS
jgi:hypothetical protein